MSRRTINEAVKSVLKKEGKPLSIEEIYSKITEYKLYEFKSKTPTNIVSTEIRRHCAGYQQSNNRELFYYKLNDGRFWLLKEPIPK